MVCTDWESRCGFVGRFWIRVTMRLSVTWKLDLSVGHNCGQREPWIKPKDSLPKWSLRQMTRWFLPLWASLQTNVPQTNVLYGLDWEVTGHHSAIMQGVTWSSPNLLFIHHSHRGVITGYHGDWLPQILMLCGGDFIDNLISVLTPWFSSVGSRLQELFWFIDL